MKQVRQKIRYYLFLFLSIYFYSDGYCQDVAVKTNLLGWATVSPNFGAELRISGHSTLDIYGSVNPFSFEDNKKWKHRLAMLEYRYWFCEAFHGHFIGAHTVGGEYNIGNTKLPFGVYPNTRYARYEGWGVGGGITYGYQWILSRYWSFEATLGVGYVYSHFKKYPCDTCGSLLESGKKHYLGVTKAALNLIYVF